MNFTYYTIIGRNPKLFAGHLDNVINYGGLNKIPNAAFLAIIYTNDSVDSKITDELVRLCNLNGVKSFVWKEQHSGFLENLYTCWNLGYELADNGYVFRAGSDQVFNKDGIFNAYRVACSTDAANNRIVLQANTVENEVAIKKIGAQSRHFVRNFGSNYEDFKYEDFENFIREINSGIDSEYLAIKEALDKWGHPTSFSSSLGKIDRVDGCSWLMTRGDWQAYGPIPSQEKGHTGDVIIHDRLQVAGYKSFIVRDCITYHFVRGESMDVQK